MHGKQKISYHWLYLLYCSYLELNLQYLRGLSMLELTKNLGGRDEEMTKADSVRDWGEQLEMPRKIKTLVNILDLYCSHCHSTN